MRRLSTVAAIACVGIIGMGLTGCGGGGGGGSTANAPAIQSATADTPCPIPAEVKKPITLTQETTREALAASVLSTDLALALGEELSNGAGFFYPTSKSQRDTKLVSILGNKSKAMKKSALKLKKQLDADTLIFGDNLPCDVNGTYSLHMSENYSEGNADGGDQMSYMTTVEASFNACQTREYSDQYDLFEEFIGGPVMLEIGDNILERVAAPVVTLNGKASLSFAYDESRKETGVSAKEVVGTGECSEKVKVHYAATGLHIETDSENFNATEDILSEFEAKCYGSTDITYDEDNASNYTKTVTDGENDTWHIAISGEELWQNMDENRTGTFNALCYDAKGNSGYEHVSASDCNETKCTDTEDTVRSDVDAVSNGYLAWNSTKDGEQLEFFDAYADNLSSSYSGKRERKRVFNGEYSVNGTVGSMLLGMVSEDGVPEGGSVTLATVVPWRVSSDYPDDRRDIQQMRAGDYSSNPFDFLDETPYVGKTVLTGKNTATVEFAYGDYVSEDNMTYPNVTYATIQIDDEEAKEYNSTEDIFAYFVF